MHEISISGVGSSSKNSCIDVWSVHHQHVDGLIRQRPPETHSLIEQPTGMGPGSFV